MEISKKFIALADMWKMFGFAIGSNHFPITGLLIGRRFPSRSATMIKIQNI